MNLLFLKGDQAGVIPRRMFYSKTQSHDKESRYFRGVGSNGVSGRHSVTGRQDSQYSDESESGRFENMVIHIFLSMFIRFEEFEETLWFCQIIESRSCGHIAGKSK